jgi:hypothetical protein
MSLKNGGLGLIALGIVLLLVFENCELWAQPAEPLPKLQKEETKPSEKKTEALAASELGKGFPSTKPHASIAERNIFSPDRKDFLTPGETTKPIIVRPRVVLYGVTIAGDYQAASVVSPGRPLHKGERETFTVKLGEKIGEYKVADIASDRITLEREGDCFEVVLYDSRMPKKRIEAKTETKPATLTSTQPAPAAQVPGPPIPSTSSSPPIPSTPSTSAASAQAPELSPPAATVTPQRPATQTPTAYPSGIRRRRI